MFLLFIGWTHNTLSTATNSSQCVPCTVYHWFWSLKKPPRKYCKGDKISTIHWWMTFSRSKWGLQDLSNFKPMIRNNKNHQAHPADGRQRPDGRPPQSGCAGGGGVSRCVNLTWRGSPPPWGPPSVGQLSSPHGSPKWDALWINKKEKCVEEFACLYENFVYEKRGAKRTPLQPQHARVVLPPQVSYGSGVFWAPLLYCIWAKKLAIYSTLSTATNSSQCSMYGILLIFWRYTVQ